MDNPEEAETQCIQDTLRRQTKQKQNTVRVEHHYAQTNTNSLA